MITNRLPFIELAIRKVFNKLMIEYGENPGFSCCPEPNGIKNYDHYIYSLAASRNLALAEKNRHDIITPCNGCFETLKSTRSEVSIEPELREKINNDLNKINLEFHAKTDVWHILEFFARKIGIERIKDSIVNPLYGLRIAVHYGCHFLRPSNKIQTDNPLDPQIFDHLVEALGAKSIKYDDKMLCCGGSLARAGKQELGVQMVKQKLDKIKNARADAIVVCCPQCFMQFDFTQRDLEKMDYKYDIPVFYYPELLAIALGIEPNELGLDKHKIAGDSIFKIIEEKRKANLEIQKNFDLNYLKTCYSCGACNDDCPPAKFPEANFNPQQIVGRILAGDIEGCIEDPAIWECLDCYLCYELCPSKVGLVDIFTKLRNLAASRDIVASGFGTEFNSFLQSGVVGKYSISHRKKQNLPIHPPEVDDLINLLKNMKKNSSHGLEPN